MGRETGSGKTTLLNTLALRHERNISWDGTYLINGEPVTGRVLREVSGYVKQQDHLIEGLTVRETFHFAAKLRLPASVKRREREQRVFFFPFFSFSLASVLISSCIALYWAAV